GFCNQNFASLGAGNCGITSFGSHSTLIKGSSSNKTGNSEYGHKVKSMRLPSSKSIKKVKRSPKVAGNNSDSSGVCRIKTGPNACSQLRSSESASLSFTR